MLAQTFTANARLYEILVGAPVALLEMQSGLKKPRAGKRPWYLQGHQFTCKWAQKKARRVVWNARWRTIAESSCARRQELLRVHGTHHLLISKPAGLQAANQKEAHLLALQDNPNHQQNLVAPSHPLAFCLVFSGSFHVNH